MKKRTHPFSEAKTFEEFRTIITQATIKTNAEMREHDPSWKDLVLTEEDINEQWKLEQDIRQGKTAEPTIEGIMRTVSGIARNLKEAFDGRTDTLSRTILGAAHRLQHHAAKARKQHRNRKRSN